MLEGALRMNCWKLSSVGLELFGDIIYLLALGFSECRDIIVGKI